MGQSLTLALGLASARLVCASRRPFWITRDQGVFLFCMQALPVREMFYTARAAVWVMHKHTQPHTPCPCSSGVLWYTVLNSSFRTRLESCEHPAPGVAVGRGSVWHCNTRAGGLT